MRCHTLRVIQITTETLMLDSQSQMLIVVYPTLLHSVVMVYVTFPSMEVVLLLLKKRLIVAQVTVNVVMVYVTTPTKVNTPVVRVATIVKVIALTRMLELSITHAQRTLTMMASVHVIHPAKAF